MLIGGRLFVGASILMRVMTAAMYFARCMLGRAVRDVMQEMLKTTRRRHKGEQSRSDELMSGGAHGEASRTILK